MAHYGGSALVDLGTPEASPRQPGTAGITEGEKISRWTPTPILSCCGGLPDPKNSARGGIGLARACRWRASGGRKAGFQGSSPVVRGPRATEAAAAALRFGLIDRNLGQIISIAQVGHGASERIMGSSACAWPGRPSILPATARCGSTRSPARSTWRQAHGQTATARPGVT